MKKKKLIPIALVCCAMSAFGLAACGGGDDEPDVPDGKVRVSFVDGSTTISTVDIDKGSTVTEPTTDPTKSGYEFVRWCATPNYSIPFDFSAPVEENTTVHAGFRSTAADDHNWFIVGESQFSDLFDVVGWKDCSQGLNESDIPSKNKFTRDANQGNKYTINADFYVGDKFQIINTVDGWSGQLGYGYLTPSQKSTDNTAPMFSGGGLGDGEAKANIQIGKSGNYTITLYIDKDGKLTEFSYNRNGDAAELAAEFNYYIKGEKVSGWQNVFADYTMFGTEDKTVYTMTIGLQESDKFMFNTVKVGDPVTEATALNASGITLATDTKTAAAIDAPLNAQGKKSDFKVIGGTGTYKLTLTEGDDDSVTLAAEKTANTVPEYDFYVKGSFGGDSKWEERHAMTLDDKTGLYQLKDVELNKDDQFQIVVTDKGVAPATGMDKDKFNINTAYAYASQMSNQIDYSTSNFKKTTDGTDTFTISIDPVNMLVRVAGEKDIVTYDVYIHGQLNGNTGWADGAKCSITQGATMTATITQTLKAGDEEKSGDTFGFRDFKSTDTAKGSQVDWANGKASDTYTWTGCDGLDGSGGNIKCTADGTYTFTVTLNNDGKFVSIVASKAQA